MSIRGQAGAQREGDDALTRRTCGARQGTARSPVQPVAPPSSVNSRGGDPRLWGEGSARVPVPGQLPPQWSLWSTIFKGSGSHRSLNRSQS